MLRTFIHDRPMVLDLFRRVIWLLSFVKRPYLGVFTLFYFLRLRKCGLPVEFSTTMIIRNPNNIIIGNNCSFSNYVILDGHDKIIIGDNCMFANNTVLATATHDYNVNPMNSVVITKPIVVGDNVWLGVGSTILPGISIGNGAVVGAGSVVTQDIPANAIVAGIPAKVLRFRELPNLT